MTDYLRDVFRSQTFTAIRNNIKNAATLAQLEAMKSESLAYYKNPENKDGAELLALYVERESELTPNSNYDCELVKTDSSTVCVTHGNNCERTVV